MLPLLTALLLLGTSSVTQGAATATLDRTQINAFDTLTLRLEVDARVDQRLDLSALEQDFRILGSKRTLISSHSSSGRAVRTRWQITLRPRSSGQLRVPPLSLAGQDTPVLSLQVADSGLPEGRPGSRAFFDYLTDRRDVYTGGQLLYSARLFHLDPLPESAIIQPPQARASTVRKIGDQRQYEGDYHGDPYLITEQQYAIFPTQVGPLQIEGPRLQLPAESGHPAIELRGDPVEIEVLAPAYRSSDGHWLPVQRLILEENWNPPPRLQPGDRLQRELTLTVTGMPAEQLPALMKTDLDGLYVEVEHLELTESMSSFGLISNRREQVSIEPLDTGSFTLPPIDLHWWDVDLDRGRHASLPSHSFSVDAPPLIEGSDDADAAAAPAGTDNHNRLLIALLTLTSIISSLGWLYSGSRLHRFRADSSASQLQETIRHQPERLQPNDHVEYNRFQALAIACRQNSASQAESCLIEWAQIFWPEQPINSLETICDATGNQTLNVLILDLDQHLRDSPELWRGDLLLQSIDSVRRRRPIHPDETQDQSLQQVS